MSEHGARVEAFWSGFLGGAAGVFSAGALVSLAALRPWSAEARGPGVITHPAQRGRGHGAAAVSSAVEGALAEGHLVIYQTLLANRPALAIARRLGFAQYASHLAVRLRDGPEAG